MTHGSKPLKILRTVVLILTFEKSPLILLLEGEKLPGSGTDLSKTVLNPPDFTLVPQTILALTHK